MIRSNNGFFGEFGGRYVPEILLPALQQLETMFFELREEPSFWQEYLTLTQEFSGRPTPLTPLRRLSAQLGGAQLWLKREDLNHSGAHKMNNVLGQGLLVQRMGKKRVIAETGAGQHGLATAIMAARLGLDATIYMGADDIERQYSNVFWMRQLGATVVGVETGARTLKEALDEALRDWAASVETTHYVLGTACGPAPFPEMVSYFQSVISQEMKVQSLAQIGRLPDEVVACVGGGSNAMGAFSAFLDDPEVALVGIEAGGISLAPGQHSVRLLPNTAETGIAQGYKTLFLQNEDGQLGDTHSIAAGLDYVGVSPILAHLSQTGRVTPESALDHEVTDAFKLLMKTEGIIPAMESAHALAGGFKRAKSMRPDQHVIINLSGRGDKDIFNIARAFPQPEWSEFLEREAVRAKELFAASQGES
ncbi:MAG: tryptophan synthase subunit beta [Reinekea forsetii]|uniref:Tryptophan synthase beta chain n=1 Tax=Reinekea forsetii TaxID=1336806 RepID=A0A2K8KJU8_9GAMM|nr:MULTISPECIES: tryptophan synthase subunit beta [Reinekea]ATX75307.1 tryptophan synthase beta chain [Reinekea forsetii]MDB9894223.1 tryptophan synthase subunit beta [Reinekea forsetii]MDO7642263.1 tryptophan synthase subunit beta [Reinekea forsetii]MDO7643176.1 tryptophan synthase subunit beta [Reinekea forsetii]MDO7674271.1 tryptophan synthase subunit beta [Reinekea forsetii]